MEDKPTPRQVNFTGLRRRPNYEEIVEELEEPKNKGKLKLPNRNAKQIRDSHFLTQLDGISMVELQEQSFNHQKEVEKEHRIREAAYQTNKSTSEVRATQTQQQPPQTFDIATGDDPMEATSEVIGDVQTTMEETEQARKQNIINLIEHNMGEATTQGHQLAHQMAQAQSAPMPPQQSQSASSSTNPVVEQPVRKTSGAFTQMLEENKTIGKQKVIKTIGDKQPTRGRPKQSAKQAPPPVPVPEVTIEALMEDRAVSEPPKSRSRSRSQQPRQGQMKPNNPIITDDPMPEAKKRETEPTPEPKRKAKAKPSPSQPASASTEPAIVDTPPAEKKGSTAKRVSKRASSEPPPETERPPHKALRVAPSKANIEILYEVLQNAKNKNLLSVSDISSYLKAYDNYIDAHKAKNKEETEKALKELRAIYKTVYKQV